MCFNKVGNQFSILKLNGDDRSPPFAIKHKNNLNHKVRTMQTFRLIPTTKHYLCERKKTSNSSNLHTFGKCKNKNMVWQKRLRTVNCNEQLVYCYLSLGKLEVHGSRRLWWCSGISRERVRAKHSRPHQLCTPPPLSHAT